MSVRQCTPPKYLPLFSSRPGIKIAFPGLPCIIQAFPTALRLFADQKEARELVFPTIGVPKDWTVFVDAMRRIISIEGRGTEGFFRIHIESTLDGLSLRSMKGPFEIRDRDQTTVLQRGASMVFASSYSPAPFPMPRLLLGCNKELNWDRIAASSDMNEILPLWYQLGSSDHVTNESSSTLFGTVVDAIRSKDKGAVFPACRALFHAGIDGMFVPKKVDDCFLGYSVPAWPDEMDLPTIQTHMCSAIRSLFLIEEGAVVDLLPCLPRECVAGRLLRERLSSEHVINIEWRKGFLRRVFVRAAHDGSVTFRAAPRMGWISRLRSRARKKQFLLGEAIEVRQGEDYLLDNFSM